MGGGGLDLPFQDQHCYPMTSLPSASPWTCLSFQHLLAPFNFLGLIFLLHFNSSSTQKRLRLTTIYFFSSAISLLSYLTCFLATFPCDTARVLQLWETYFLSCCQIITKRR